MHFKFRNVNDAFRGLVRLFYEGKVSDNTPVDVPIVESPSRYGEVMYIEEPVTITYTSPRERVLFNRARDANPFFHLYESLWMLAGRNDVASLAHYNSRMPEFSDDGKTFNGAYGYRWRIHYYGEPRLAGVDPNDWRNREGVDQLAVLIAHLKANPRSRRAVLQMWTVEDDLLKIDSSKDVCCNLSVMFSVGFGPCMYCNGRGYLGSSDKNWGGPDPVMGPLPQECPKCKGKPHDQPLCLNMTVTNRSNDLVWGLLGANVVHFSILQEYVAAHLGLEVGTYNHFTNNLHIYTAEDRWKPEEWLSDDSHYAYSCPVSSPSLFPLVQKPEVFDRELPEFVERHNKDAYPGSYSEPFLASVAQPMCAAFHLYKAKHYWRALSCLQFVQADDWRIAATEWIKRRIK